MTSAQLIDCMASAGCSPFGSLLVLDCEYACPALDYLQEDFSEDFRGVLWDEGLMEWKVRPMRYSEP